MQEVERALGQIFMVGFDGLEPDEHIADMIRNHGIGGVILFRRNMHTPEQLTRLCARLQEINAEVCDEPLLIALDQEGGMVMRIEQGVTPIPSAMAFAHAGGVECCEQMNAISGHELMSMGVNMNLAPVLDVNNNRNNPVIGVRAYGEDPDTVERYGLAAMRGLQSAGMLATAKHFPGHGDTAVDSHYAMPVVPHDRNRLDAIELRPFRSAIEAGVDAIMTAHVVFPAFEPDGLPATLSSRVLTGLLREELGFEGLVITDCLEMAAIADGVGVGEGAIQTVLAGADLVLVSHRRDRQLAAIEAVRAALGSGRIAPARVGAALQRVRRLKEKYRAAQETWGQCGRPAIMAPESLHFSEQVQAAAVQSVGEFQALSRAEPVLLITAEVRARTEIDELALSRNKEPRGSMLDALRERGFDVSELAVSAEVSEHELAEARAFVGRRGQIVVQTYNAILMPGQQALIASVPQDRMWLVAGRLPYDLDLVPNARARLAAFGCRPPALEPVVARLAGDEDKESQS